MMCVAPLTLASGGLEPGLITDVLVILAMAGAVGVLARRVGLATIPAYLIAGALLGPRALALVHDEKSVDQVSRLAIVVLMFVIGLQLDIASIRRGLGSIVFVGVLSSTLSALALWPLALALGLTPPAALAVAAAMAISSTAVLMRLLQDRRELRLLHGRLGIGISIVQDLLSVVALATIPLMAVYAQAHAQAPEGGDLPGPLQALSTLARAVGGTAGMIVLGRLVLPRLLSRVAAVGGTGSDELVLVISSAVALGAAIFSGAVGLSPELGAFIAGFTVGCTPFRHQLAGQLLPLRDLLMAVFFTAVGLNVDPGLVLGAWWIVALGTLAVMLIKLVTIGGSAYLVGVPAPAAFVTAVYLANAGEFSLVLIAIAGEHKLVTGEQQGVFIAMIVLSLVLSPLLVPPAQARAGWFSRFSRFRRSASLTETGTHEEGPERRRAIVAGFGPVGRHLAEGLERDGFACTVVELNPATVQRQSALGRAVVYGDVTNSEVLESAGVRHAEAIFLTMPDQDALVRACRLARSMAPGIVIAARTSFLSQALLAKQAGADHATIEEVATARAMWIEVAELIALRRGERGTPS